MDVEESGNGPLPPASMQVTEPLLGPTLMLVIGYACEKNWVYIWPSNRCYYTVHLRVGLCKIKIKFFHELVDFTHLNDIPRFK